MVKKKKFLLPKNAGDVGMILGSGRFPWRRKWQPTPVFLPGEPHGQKSLVGCDPWGHKRVSYDSGTKHTHNNNTYMLITHMDTYAYII